METPFVVALMAGGCAGITVDVCLFPLDTLKTRLQAEAGFRQAGGFRGIYRGLLATAAGSGPSGIDSQTNKKASVLVIDVINSCFFLWCLSSCGLLRNL
eukprot:m.110548 g.110548  ORF g.110548 m.110548 type:complete len:99 (-) comp22727_c0_seq2:755-1051(-)